MHALDLDGYTLARCMVVAACVWMAVVGLSGGISGRAGWFFSASPFLVSSFLAISRTEKFPEMRGPRNFLRQQTPEKFPWWVLVGNSRKRKARNFPAIHKAGG